MTLLHPVADRIGELPTSERESLRGDTELREQDVDEQALHRPVAAAHPLERGAAAPDRGRRQRPDGSRQPRHRRLRSRADGLAAVAALTSADGHGASNPLVAISDERAVLDGLDIETLAAAVQAAVPATDWVVRRMASFAGGNTAVAIELVRSLSPDQRRPGGLPERSGASGSRRHCPRPASRGAEHRGTHGARCDRRRHHRRRRRCARAARPRPCRRSARRSRTSRPCACGW